MKNRLITVSGVFAVFLFWIIVAAIVANPMLVPTPWASLQALFAILSAPAALAAIAMTSVRLVAAMGVAAVAGIGAGLAAGRAPSVDRFLRPLVTVLRTVPVISIVVIVLIVFGFAATPYLITFLMVFPLLFQATAEGIRRIDPELIDVYRLEDDHVFRGLRHCYIPLIAADLRTALLQGAGLGVKVLVMAEYLAQTRASIGNELYLAKVELDFASVFAWTALLVAMAAAIEALVRRSARPKTASAVPLLRTRSETD